MKVQRARDAKEHAPRTRVEATRENLHRARKKELQYLTLKKNDIQGSWER